MRDSLGPARRAYKAHQRVLTLDPQRRDAALIVGTTRHAVASLSAPLRLIAYLAGFDGNSDRGLRLVEEAAQYPGETRRNALFTLVLLYNREGRYDAALQVGSNNSKTNTRAIDCCGSKRATHYCVPAGGPTPQRRWRTASRDWPATRGRVPRARNRAGSRRLPRHEVTNETDHSRRLRFGGHSRAHDLDGRRFPVVSREDLAARFDADMRNVIIEWDRDDARSEHVRRKSLFDFVYQTYDASAWIPQSLFDGNLATQVIVGDVDTIVAEKVGLVLWRDNPLVPAFGMAPNAISQPAPVELGTSHSGGR